MGFLAPWFLGGLAALGVPVFVHLLRKHVTTPQPVSSLMFFERGQQSSTKHRRLRYLLLFALRFLFVLLLVLAFADPFVRRPAVNATGQLLVVVLDDSFSMRAGGRFAEAKLEALALLAAKPKTQKAQVMALGGQLRVLTQATENGEELRAALESIGEGDGRGALGDLGRGVRALGETVRGGIDVHLFSDLQRSGMPGNFADMVMPGSARLVLHSVARGSAVANWTVESVEAPAELADPKDTRRSRVRAVVAGFGTPAARLTAALVVNGKVTATKPVDVPANGRGRVEFAPLDVGYGFNRCEVRLQGADAFAADDAAYLAVRRSDPERVLFVHRAGETRSALYFGAALGAAAEGAYTLQSTTADQAADLDPGRFAFVVLSDVAGLPPIFERALGQYVAKGGGVLVALGTGAGRHGAIPLWGGVKAVRSGGVATVGTVDFTYPPLEQAQPGQESGGWGATKVFYASVVEAGQARVAARLNDGTPLLLDRAVGEGHEVLLTTGMDNLTNDLPLHPVFVAFVDRAARYLAGSERLSGARVVDTYVPLRAGATAGSVEVVDPHGRRPLSLAEARTAQTIRLEQAGFYQIRLASGRDAVVGVNADRRESDLEAMPEDVQRLWMGASGEGAGVGEARAEGTQRVGLWWWFMLLALLVGLAERVLASGYMGTQREEA